MKYSLNGRIILEVYKTDGSIKSEIKGGLAFAQQKTALKGLRVLMDTTSHNVGYPSVHAGDIAYIREEDLHNKDWAKKPLTCGEIPEPFIIVDLKDVQFIEYK